MESDIKTWERSWTLEEMRENSANWNLAGDAGLLKHLESFSSELIKKTHDTKCYFDKLFMDLNGISTELSNVTNSFLYLSNTQFVESRVYDDDDEQEEEASNTHTHQTTHTKTQNDLDTEKINKIKEAFNYGMTILDSLYEVVEVPATSDSEEETSTSHEGAFLKPKNFYADRPLPFLIGSREFMEDDNIGLQDTYSDNEESPDQNYEESSIGSDLEMDSKNQFDKLSDISAEMSSKASPSNKTAHENIESIFEPSQQNFVFPDNLLNKPSGLTASNEIGSEDSLFGESSKDDLFGSNLNISHKDNLFDSTKDKDSIKSQHITSSNNIQPDSHSDLFGSSSTKMLSSKIGENLFDDNDEDDLFQETNKTYKSNEFTANGEYVKTNKTPPGGVPIFGNVNLFNKNSLKKVISVEDDEDDDLFNQKSKDIEKSNQENKTLITKSESKKNSLSSIDNQDIFNTSIASSSNKEKQINVPEASQNKSVSKKISSLFSDSDSDNDDFLFFSKTIKTSSLKSSEKSSEVFSDTQSNIFEKTISTNETSKKNINNLFDDEVDDNIFSNDLFSNKEKDIFDFFSNQSKPHLFEENIQDQNVISKNESQNKIENITKPNPPKTLNLLKTTEITDIFDQSFSTNEPSNTYSNKDYSDKNREEPPLLKETSKNDDIIINVPSKPTILHSALKERAKIQTKRKPSSRKARQESYKQTGDSIEYFTNEHSSREFLLNKNSNKTSPSIPSESSSDSKVENTYSPQENTDQLFTDDLFSKPLTTNMTSLLSPSTDEEDLFGIPQHLPSDKDQEGTNIFQGAKFLSPPNLPSSQNQSKDRESQNNLYSNPKNEDDDDDDDLFSGHTNVIKIGHSSTAKASSSLFEEDDNLFDSLKSNLKQGSSKLLTKSLFDDDDNDDIFFTKTN